MCQVEEQATYCCGFLIIKVPFQLPIDIAYRSIASRNYRVVAIDFVYAKEIVYCEADKDTTLVVLSDGRQFAATRNLSFYAKSMQLDFNFFRISDKQLVNLDFVQTYEHHKNYQLTLVNGVVLHASRRGGQDLRQYIASNYHSDNITTSAGSISPKVDSLSSLIKNFLK